MKLPQLIRSIALRRQQRRDGGYDMVPAYTVSEMIAYGEECARGALEEAARVCDGFVTTHAAAAAIRAIEVKHD